MLQSNIQQILIRLPSRGKLFPFSMLEIWLSETPIASASSACLIPHAFLRCIIRKPIIIRILSSVMLTTQWNGNMMGKNMEQNYIYYINKIMKFQHFFVISIYIHGLCCFVVFLMLFCSRCCEKKPFHIWWKKQKRMWVKYGFSTSKNVQNIGRLGCKKRNGYIVNHLGFSTENS